MRPCFSGWTFGRAAREVAVEGLRQGAGECSCAAGVVMSVRGRQREGGDVIAGAFVVCAARAVCGAQPMNQGAIRGVVLRAGA